MSYDSTTDKMKRQSRAMERMQQETEDIRRFRFLEVLDRAQFEVTVWEADFIETIFRIAASHPVDDRVPHFTPAQRQVIDRMREEYEERL